MTATTNANNHSMRKYCKRFRLCNGNWEFLGDLTRQSSTGATHDDFAWQVSQSQMRPATPNPPSNHRLNISVEGLSQGRLRARKIAGEEGCGQGRLRARKIAGAKGSVQGKARARKVAGLEDCGQGRREQRRIRAKKDSGKEGIVKGSKRRRARGEKQKKRS